MSNTPVAGFLSSNLGKLEGNEVKDEERHNNALSFTKRRWRDAVEALSMLEDAISGFSAAINPITIQTMAMLVGDESLQFRFVNSKQTRLKLFRISNITNRLRCSRFRRAYCST